MRKYQLIDEGRAQFPKGVPLELLLDELVAPRPDEDPKMPEFYRLQELQELIKPHAKYWYEDTFKWDEHLHRLPLKTFEGWTTDEKLRMTHRTIFCNEVADEFECNARYTHFRKIELSYWHWGPSDSYADIVRTYNGIRKFSFGIDEFETHLDYTSGCNEFGYANFHRNIFLDGELGFMIYHKGTHVLTIGFSACKAGILLAQAQCTKPKGNRWLFKLKTPLLQHVVDRMRLAFPEDPIWLINGQSLAIKTQRDYQNSKMEISRETVQHIAESYKTPLPGLRRSKHYRRKNLLFKQLTPKEPLPLAA